MVIGIFPASGALGSSTYTHLLKLVPNNEVVLINRFPEKIPISYSGSGVRVRQASYESSPEELKQAFEGVDVLFLISYPSHVREYRVKVQLPAIEAARKAGVKHIFYSSLGFAGQVDSQSSAAVVMQAHLDTEKYLATLAIGDPSFTYTVIREGLYSESTPIYTGFSDFAKAQEILIPHDGTGAGVSWVKRDELGEASAKLIAAYAADPDRFGYVNRIILLTGPKEWSLKDTVRVLSEKAGRDVKIKQISTEEYVNLPQVQAVFGTDEKARTWATAWEAIRQGETATVTDTMERILGRKPEEFDVTITS